MTFRTFEDWIAVAFPWLTDPDSPDRTALRAAWDAGQQGREWVVLPWDAHTRNAKNEIAAWEAGKSAGAAE